jgi:hypothetical protein
MRLPSVLASAMLLSSVKTLFPAVPGAPGDVGVDWIARAFSGRFLSCNLDHLAYVLNIGGTWIVPPELYL